MNKLINGLAGIVLDVLLDRVRRIDPLTGKSIAVLLGYYAEQFEEIWSDEVCRMISGEEPRRAPECRCQS